MDSLHTFSRHLKNDKLKREEFTNVIRYCLLDLPNAEGYKKLLELVHKMKNMVYENRMFYLSVAPEFFEVIALNINRVD